MRGRVWALGLVSTATFMLVIDITVVNVALPQMQASLHARLTDLEWVVDAYVLALASLMVIAGSTADHIGRKRLFIAGMAVFTAGSLLDAVSPSAALLIGARALQGTGGAILFATALAIIGQEYPGPERARALGVWGAAIGAGLAVGPLAGGLLTDAFGWQAIFLVNVPIGVAVVALSAVKMSESADPGASSLDWTGAAVFATLLFALVFALIEGNTLGWSSPAIVASLAVAVVLVPVLARVERREMPLFDLSLFANPSFLAATLAVVGQGVVIGAMLFYLLRYLQEAFGASPLLAGAEVLPMTLVAFVAALGVGRLPARMTEHTLLALPVLALGTGALALSVIGLHDRYLLLLPGMVLVGAGWGGVNPVSAGVSLRAAPKERSGMASGINNTARQVGIALGLGGLGALFQARVTSVIGSSSLLPAAVRGQLARALARSGGSLAGVGALRRHPGVVAVTHQALLAGLHAVLWAGTVAALVTAVAIYLIGRRHRRAGAEQETASS
ncbi:MAG: MFS transporter [Acidimicrobiales bacterium]